MYSLSLSKRQMEAFYSTLKESHRIKVVVHIHNPDEEQVNDFDFHFGTTHILEGAVQVDTTADIKRSLSITFLDPNRRFRWSPDRTSPGTLYSGDFISVRYVVYVNDDNLRVGDRPVDPHTTLGQGTRHRYPVEVPVFWGPLTAYEANGPEITIEAQGKETLGLDPMFITDGFALDKHERVDDAIKEVMKKVGETRFKIPELPYRLPKKRTIDPRTEPWKVIVGGQTDSTGKHVAGLINKTGKHPHEAFYDGAGRLKVRRVNKEPSHTFTEHWMVSPPDVTWDDTTFINHVHVTGSRGGGKNAKPVKADVTLRKKHPLSPWSLARNGKPRYLSMYVQADNLKTDKDCRQRARHLLAHHSMVGVTCSFDCLPMPLLEENDVIRVKTDDFTFKFPVKQFTIPLTSDSPMTIGDNARVHTIKRKKSTRHHSGSAGGPKPHPGRKGGQN